MRPTELGALVLQGMAMSTYFRGASVSQKAITGMLTYAASVMAYMRKGYARGGCEMQVASITRMLSAIAPLYTGSDILTRGPTKTAAAVPDATAEKKKNADVRNNLDAETAHASKHRRPATR